MRRLNDAAFILEWFRPGTRRAYQNRFNNPDRAQARFDLLKDMGLRPRWVRHPFKTNTTENK